MDEHAWFTIVRAPPINRGRPLIVVALTMHANRRSSPMRRSARTRKFVPQFHMEELERSLTQAGIKYLSRGSELGGPGRPEDERYYDRGRRVL